jgi:thiamine biosynthesis lipoprotein ApbE
MRQASREKASETQLGDGSTHGLDDLILPHASRLICGLTVDENPEKLEVDLCGVQQLFGSQKLDGDLSRLNECRRTYINVVGNL